MGGKRSVCSGDFFLFSSDLVHVKATGRDTAHKQIGTLASLISNMHVWLQALAQFSSVMLTVTDMSICISYQLI